MSRKHVDSASHAPRIEPGEAAEAVTIVESMPRLESLILAP